MLLAWLWPFELAQQENPSPLLVVAIYREKVNAMRISFSQLFKELPGGGFSPLRHARIRGVDLKPGLWIGEGMRIVEVELSSLAGRELELEMEQGVAVLK